MASYGSLHWRAPISMLVALLVGILLALGHHSFYQGLAGSTVPKADHSVFGVSKQKINVSAGTAFALSVKACFAFSISVAYTQLVWRSVKGQQTKLASLDALFSILQNATFLVDYSLWLKYPLILSTALSVWLIPIVAVTTPATLNVETVPVTVTLSNSTVPMVDFDSLNFAYVTTEPYNGSKTMTYLAPEYPVTKIVAATVAQGIVLPFSAALINSSWAVEFSGPAVRCNPVQTSLRQAMLSQIAYYRESYLPHEKLAYLGWTPTNESLPFAQSENGPLCSRGYSLGPLYYYRSGEYESVERANSSSTHITLQGVLAPAQIYLAVFPKSKMIFDDGDLSNTTLISCELYNASYYTEFDFRDGIQTVIASITEPYNDILALDTVSWGIDVNPYQSYHPNGSVIKSLDASSGTSRGTYNATIPRIIAYQAVFDAFSKHMIGSISTADDVPVARNTSIMPTVLLDTMEMLFLKDPLGDGHSSMAQAFFEMSLDLVGTPPSMQDPTPDIGHLQDVLEKLFQNITVNLMTSKFLQPTSPLLTNVTQDTYINIYIYAAPTLLIAYSVATIVTSIIVLIGLVAILSNCASYSTNFSTIVRATRHANLSVKIHSLDVGGQDPLPRYLAKGVMTFPQITLSGYAELQSDRLSLVPFRGRHGFNDTASISGETIDEEFVSTTDEVVEDTIDADEIWDESTISLLPRILLAPPLARYNDR